VHGDGHATVQGTASRPTLALNGDYNQVATTRRPNKQAETRSRWRQEDAAHRYHFLTVTAVCTFEAVAVCSKASGLPVGRTNQHVSGGPFILSSCRFLLQPLFPNNPISRRRVCGLALHSIPASLLSSIPAFVKTAAGVCLAVATFKLSQERRFYEVAC